VAVINDDCFIRCSLLQKGNKTNPSTETIAIAKNNNAHIHLKQTIEYSSNLVVKWLNMQLDMLRVTLVAGTGAQASERCQVYCGIALYESVLPEMPAYWSLSGHLTDFPVMRAVS
jgi:hypothetical protein